MQAAEFLRCFAKGLEACISIPILSRSDVFARLLIRRESSFLHLPAKARSLDMKFVTSPRISAVLAGSKLLGPTAQRWKMGFASYHASSPRSLSINGQWRNSLWRRFRFACSRFSRRSCFSLYLSRVISRCLCTYSSRSFKTCWMADIVDQYPCTGRSAFRGNPGLDHSNARSGEAKRAEY